MYVIEALQDKMFDKFDKQVVDDADRGRGEDGENEEGATEDLPVEDDPMLLLGACSPEAPPETPQKKPARVAPFEMTIKVSYATSLPHRGWGARAL